MSYEWLAAAADRTARRLAGLGAIPESLVAVLMGRSPLLLVAMLAVWRAGAAYLPVDPGYPAERKAFMLADAAPAVVVTDRAHAAEGPGPAATPPEPEHNRTT